MSNMAFLVCRTGRVFFLISRIHSHSESANVLEAESGYSLETARVSDFRAAVLGGSWNKVADMLPSIGVLSRDLQVSGDFTRVIGFSENVNLIRRG